MVTAVVERVVNERDLVVMGGSYQLALASLIYGSYAIDLLIVSAKL
jgi:hypothetical protein